MEKITSYRRTAVAIGVLFLIATIAYGSGSAVVTNRPLVGSFLEFVDVVAVIGIGVLFFSILKRYSTPIAWTYLATRILEAVLLSVSIAGIFLGSTLLYDRAFQLAMLILGLGSLPFVYLLFWSKLIPRVISSLGFIGYAALLLWALLELSGYATGFVLFAPGALFEILFPIWLIIKGFNSAAPESEARQF